MASSASTNRLEYQTPHGMTVIPYKGDVTSVTADGVVTREDNKMTEESGATKALIKKYSDFQEKRDTLEKRTHFFFFRRPLKLWSVETTKLATTSNPVKCIFHAIITQSDDKWEANMMTLYLNLLKEAEKCGIQVLAIPLLGSGKPAARVVVKCISEHKPKTVKTVFLISLSQADITEIIVCCKQMLVLVRGNQPSGTMTVISSRHHLPGFENCGTLTITYNFPDGTQEEGHPSPGKPYKGIRKDAYLPNSKEGKEVLGLLHEAFLQKLTFTVGRSTDKSKGHVVWWNDIPHKTSIKDEAKHSYPDPKYLINAKDDLNKRGITNGKRIRIDSKEERVDVRRQKRDLESIQRENSDSHLSKSLQRENSDSHLSKSLQRENSDSHLSMSPQKEKSDLDGLQEKIEIKGLVVKDNDAKGNCMFQALTQQIAHVLKKDIEHKELRQNLVQYLRDNPKMSDGTPYENFLGGIGWDKYLDKMARDGCWGDQLMLIAAANCYGVEIIVIADDGKETPNRPDVEYSWSLPIYLGHVKGKHYVSLE